MSLNNGPLYPISLASSELACHRQAVNEYHHELSYNLHQLSQHYRADLALIKSQPELTLDLRTPLLDFLYKVLKRTKLAPGIFYDAIKLFDRYCLKRVVLKSQAQLVGCTCIWLAAKNEGGCNHIVNLLNKPISSRFQGPTQRSRIPRVIEFVQLCGPSCGYDEGMFIQMERHILNTLEWSILLILAYNWVFNVHELETMMDGVHFQDHIKMYYIKSFLVELLLYLPAFVMHDPAQIGAVVKKLILILILNEENHFGIHKLNLQKILDDNRTDGCGMQTPYMCDNVFTSSHPKDSLLFYIHPADNSEVNKLIYAIATVSNTLFQSYTNTEYREVNEVIQKIHKVSVSHIMALKEEEREMKQQMSYMHSPPYDRSPGSLSTTSSNSDYEDSYLTFSRKGSLDTNSSSVISSPLPLPVGKVTRRI